MIRPIRATDAAALAALIRGAFAAGPQALDPPPSALNETEASVMAHLAAGGGGALVEQGSIVACVLWSERDGGLYVSRLATDPGCRRQGLAMALMHAAEIEARDRGLPQVHLGVRLALRETRRMYARLGYTETTQHTHEGYKEPTWTAMEKALATAPPPGTGTPPG